MSPKHIYISRGRKKNEWKEHLRMKKEKRIIARETERDKPLGAGVPNPVRNWAAQQEESK